MNSVLDSGKYDEICRLLNEVGLEVINKRKQDDFWIQTKEDKSLVTNVDFWANEVLCNRFKELFPNDEIIGEESKNKSYKKDAERVWYIDPIDGTKAYTKGEDHFYILIGLAINGIPTIGFCYKPIEKLLISTWENSVQIKKDGKTLPIPNLNWNSNSSLVLKQCSAAQKNYLETNFRKTKEPYVYDMVSQMGPIFGKSIGYIGFRRTYYWDLCAPAAIMKALGYKHDFFHANAEKARMNDGSIKCRTHYALPHDVPQELLNWFKNESALMAEDDE